MHFSHCSWSGRAQIRSGLAHVPFWRLSPHLYRARLPSACAAGKRHSSSSNLIAQEVLLFCFQQDLESTLVRALNTDNQFLAQDVRDRLQAIDAVVQEVQSIKDAAGGGEGTATPSDLTESLRLRSGLQQAIMDERYDQAARLRDELKILQDKLDAAAGKADAASKKLREERQLRLGQRVLHKQQKYRAIVCGWDGSCSESQEWRQSAGISELSMGADQPFYQLLVDVRDAERVTDTGAGLIAYVAQECLTPLECDDSWTEEFGGDGFANPFKLKLFLGKDECGDFLPARALYEKFGQERRDVFPLGQGDEKESEQTGRQSQVQQSPQQGDANMLDRLFVQSDDDPPEGNAANEN